MAGPVEIDQSINILKALADVSRLMIASGLMERPQYVEELAQRLGLAISTVSFHLKKLEKAGLVHKRKEQYYVTYFIDESVFGLTLKELLSFENVEKVAQEERIQKYRAKIVRTFFHDGRLTKLPAQDKKRRVVLEELAKRFEVSRTYGEREVNDLIAASFEDYCAIRRLFITEGLMERRNGQYRRCETRTPGPEGDEFDYKHDNPVEPVSKEETMSAINRQKALKKAYLEQGTPMGVFQILNTENQRRLIGVSRNVRTAFNKHRFQLKNGSHRMRDLQEDWNKFGEEAFTFEVLDELEPLADRTDQQVLGDLAELEALWREKLGINKEQEYSR